MPIYQARSDAIAQDLASAEGYMGSYQLIGTSFAVGKLSKAQSAAAHLKH
jgi:hypothetical protein